MVQYCIARCNIVLHSAILYCMVQYCIARCNIVLHGAILYCTVQYEQTAEGLIYLTTQRNQQQSCGTRQTILISI